MKYQRALWVLVPLLLLACEDDNTVNPPPPVPLSPEEQVVVNNCRAIRDALESYAASHGGSYGEGWIDWVDLGIRDLIRAMKNPYSGEEEPSGFRANSPGQIGVEEYACDGTVSGYRITGYGRDRMLIVLESMGNVPASVRDAHDVTVANALLVMDAAKRYAAANDGEFPGDLSAVNNDGKTLIDLLPNGEHLINPVSGYHDVPGNGSAAESGDIGFTGTNSDGDEIMDAFLIEALVCDVIILFLVPYTQYGEYVHHDCHTLRTAVEEFADESGFYPQHLDAETTPSGKTVLNIFTEIDYDHDTDFENPYTKEHYYPTIGIATGKGEIGYQLIKTAGVVTSFTITGRGVFDEIVRIGPKPAP